MKKIYDILSSHQGENIKEKNRELNNNNYTKIKDIYKITYPL